MPTNNQIDVNGGTNQVASSVGLQQQVFLGDQFAEQLLKSKDTPLTLVVLGAGADATMGLPTSSNLIPRIVAYLETEEGKQIDELLRKTIGSVRFHFDKFVSNAIDRLAKDLDKELVTICQNINNELRNNPSLDEQQQKMGHLITRLFSKIIDFKTGATIDAETEGLIGEVFNIVVKDDSIIDFTHINYTETFRSLIIEILRRSMHETGNPILRHVYRNILDIEQLLTHYFYGFYTDRTSYVRDYLYISWILWAYLVSEQQRIAQLPAPQSAESTNEAQPSRKDLYHQLQSIRCQLLTFNYTTLAREASSETLYFHGSLTEYVDVENKNDFTIADLSTLDLPDFIQNRLAEELSFDPERRAIPIPSFLPPLKLQPLLSKHYIDTWYKASQLMFRANRILILGYSFSSPDAFFCDLLRSNRNAEIIVIDKNIDVVSSNLCAILQLPANGYSSQKIQGHEHRRYANRISIIGADLADIDLAEWV